jgi:hypothetical protein
MALATQADVEAALGRVLSASEVERVEFLLARSSGLVIGYTGQDFEPAPYPEAVTSVAASVVARLFQQGEIPVGLESTTEGAGPFSRGYKYGGGSSGEVWLSAADKLILRPYRRGSGLTSVQLVGERYKITEP